MSRLEENSREYREQLVAKNNYNKTGEYNLSHKNAQSDGDEKGKHDLGSEVDIQARERLITKNTYNKSSEYNISNA